MKDPKPAKPGQKKTHVSDTPSGSNGSLGREVQDVIGKQLRAMYDDLVSQPVPDRFAELLKNLDKQEDEGKQ